MMSADGPAIEPADLRPLAEIALRRAPRAPFVDLFPHLAEAWSEPIAGRHGMSIRLANVLRAWYGVQWGPYLDETPRSLMMRRGVGRLMLGEFLGLAVDAAYRPQDTVEGSPIELPVAVEPMSVTESPAWADRARNAQPILARLASFDAPPSAATLRESMESIVRVAGDVPLRVLIPALDSAGDGPIVAVPAISPFLPRFLGLTHGFRWKAYLEETPTSLTRHRYGGPATIGALLWLAAQFVRGEGPTPHRSTTSPGSSLGESAASADVIDALSHLAVLIDQTSPRDRVVIERRLVDWKPKGTLADLAREFCCSRERVRQIQGWLARRIRAEVELVDSLQRTVRHLRRSMGMAWPIQGLDRIPGVAGTALTDPERLEAALLLWAAGPYERVEGWLMLKPAPKRILDAKRELRRPTRAGGPVSLDDARRRLAPHELSTEIDIDWIRAFTRFDIADGMIVTRRRR